LEGDSDSAGVLLAVSSTLDPKAFCGRIASVLPLSAGVGFLFKGIIKKLNWLFS